MNQKINETWYKSQASAMMQTQTFFDLNVWIIINCKAQQFDCFVEEDTKLRLLGKTISITFLSWPIINLLYCNL